MNKKINVLIFPCGAENAIEAYYALKDVVNIKLFGASGRSDHGEYIYENYIPNVPFINTEEFLPCLNQLIEKYEIDVVIPTHDDVVLKLAENEKNIKAKILVHGYHQAVICRSKKLTYEQFKGEDFCPEIYNSTSDIKCFPVIVKPDKGQGSKGAFLAKSEKDLINSDFNFEEYVVCENLPNEEITVDCLTNYKGELTFIGPRLRSRINNGISARSSTIPLCEEIKSIANIISNRLKLNGLWYFQLKKDINGKYKLLEVSLRISGTMNLYRVKGINFPLLAVYNSLLYDLNILENKFNLEVDRALVNRYKHDIDYEHIYIDFDDTITRGLRVNSEVIGFLYNSINNGKKLYLITKHRHNIFDTLDNLKIHSKIFESVIHLNPESNKADYIEFKKKSIFIDNSFDERIKINKELGIPVFDVDAINILLNWKN